MVPPRQLVQKHSATYRRVSVEEVEAMLTASASRSSMPVRATTSPRADIMEGAVWRDPERIEEWIGELSKAEPVVTFCVYGFHIGCQTAIALRSRFRRQYMTGGHYGWKAMGGKVRLFEGD